MKFTLVTEVGQPRDLVFEVQRDHLPNLVSYLPNVEAIVRVMQEEDGEVLRVRNEWRGSTSEIPAVLRPLLKPEWTSWSDEAVWDQGQWRCSWQTHLNIFPGAITSKGTTSFEEEGNETVVTVHGEFAIDPAKVTGIPLSLAKRVGPVIEKFVLGVLEPNLRQTFEAIEEYIDDNF
ncbi:MAG: hypothetical protein JRJ84_17015 [Deltaproteobacteria bacterium]|nr:hypothetical protein [Deltaproteobacteria bacterium]